MVDTKLVVEICLWTILAFAIAGLVTALVMSCGPSQEGFQHKEGAKKMIKAQANSDYISDQAKLNARCGPKCQHVHPDEGVWKTPSEYYPNLPQDPTACNIPPNKWLAMSPEEGVRNLTKKIGNKRYICNKSCPPAEVACGLDDSGLGDGVMDSVSVAGALGSAEVIKSSGMIPGPCSSNSSLLEGFENEKKPLDHFVGDAYMGYVCCKNGKPIQGNAGSLGTISPEKCLELGGDSFTETAADCVSSR